MEKKIVPSNECGTLFMEVGKHVKNKGTLFLKMLKPEENDFTLFTTP